MVEPAGAGALDLPLMSRSIGRLVESDIKGGIGNEEVIYG